jgi:hypothetical protein
VLPVLFMSRIVHVAVDKENISGLRVVAHFADQSKNPFPILEVRLLEPVAPDSAPASPAVV